MANFIHHFKNAHAALASKKGAKSSHMSMYNSLFLQWNASNWCDNLSINRSETMKMSRIGSQKTYYKVLRELQAWGFIFYKPSNDPLIGSVVNMVDFSSSHEQVGNKSRGKSDPSMEQVMPSSINNIKNENFKTRVNAHPTIEEVFIFFRNEGHEEMEAQKFFFHYDGLGWAQGNNKIVNWHSFARKWMLGEKRVNSSGQSISSQPNNHYETQF